MFDDEQDSAQNQRAYEKTIQTSIQSTDLQVRVDGLMYFVNKYSNEPVNNELVVPYALAAADIYEKLNQPLQQFGALWSAADAYKAMDLTKECLEICKQAYQIAVENFATVQQALMLNNISLAHLEMDEVQLAIDSALASAVIWVSEEKSFEAAKAYSLLANAHQQNNDPNAACLSLDEAIKLLKESDAHHRLVENLWRKTDMLIAAERWDEATDAHSVCLAHQHLLRQEFHKIPITYNEARLKAHQHLHEVSIEMYEQVLSFWRSKNNLENLALVTIELSKSLDALGLKEKAVQELNAVLLVADSRLVKISPSKIQGQIDLINSKVA